MSNEREIVTVRLGEGALARQGVIAFPGISGRTAGTRGLTLYKVVIPPGGRAVPHTHKGFETAIYVLQGRVETRYGDRLDKSVVNVAGDFLFIPPDMRHQPVNLSDSEPAIGIVARNNPEEEEDVILSPDEDNRDP